MDNYKRLSEDHENAKQLARGLAEIKGIEVSPEEVKTNIVLFKTGKIIKPRLFINEMEKRGVKLIYFGGGIIRAVTNRMVSKDLMNEATSRIKGFLS